MDKEELMRLIDATPGRSAWTRGVKDYACLILDKLDDDANFLELYLNGTLHDALLNGAENWHQYSWGGSALCYDTDIAEALCNPTELKITNGGRRRPNKREEWLDVQARALFQACVLIRKILGGKLK